MKKLSDIMESLLGNDFDISDDKVMSIKYLSTISGIDESRIKYDSNTGVVTFHPKLHANLSGLPYYMDLCPDTDLSLYGVRKIIVEGNAGLNLSGEWNCKNKVEIEACSVSVNNACKSCSKSNKCTLLSNVHILLYKYNGTLLLTTGTKFKSVQFDGLDLIMDPPVNLKGIEFVEEVGITINLSQVRSMDKYGLINFPFDVNGIRVMNWKGLTNLPNYPVLNILPIPDSKVRKILRLPSEMKYVSIVFNIYTWGVVQLLPNKDSRCLFNRIQLGVDMNK